MVERVDAIDENQRRRKAGQMTDSARDAIMQAAMNKNPNVSREANNTMANASQGNTSVSDVSRKESVSIESQQVHATGDSARVTEAKDSGLAVGTKIEQPDAMDKTRSEALLTSATDTMALYNRNDLINKTKKQV